MLEKLARYHTEINNLMEAKLEHASNQVLQLKEMHRALGPDTAFSRGFSVTMDEQGKVVKSANQLSAGDNLTTHFTDGSVDSTVTKN